VVVLYMMWKLICSHGWWWMIPLPRSLHIVIWRSEWAEGSTYTFF
jgi:hypothetical protein